MRFLAIWAPFWEVPGPPKMVQKLKKSIWDANGRHFGRTKPPMVDFDGLQNDLWMDLGGILGGFGMGFGWVWGSLDASWLMFDLLFGRVCPKGSYRNPRAASLRPAERHNFSKTWRHRGPLRCTIALELLFK